MFAGRGEVNFEVTVNGGARVIATRRMSTAEFKTASVRNINFTIDQAAVANKTDMEFRIWTNGKRKVVLTNVTIERI